MFSQRFNSVSGVLFAAAIASAAMVSDAQALDKVTLGEYCTAQSSGNPAVVHQNMDPYTNSNVTVTLSSKYGPISTPFDCRAIIPVCSGKILVFTEGAISIIHSALGGYNADDPASMTETMSKLAGSFRIVTPDNTSSQYGAEHLKKIHGMQILIFTGNSIERAPNAESLINACRDQLNR